MNHPFLVLRTRIDEGGEIHAELTNVGEQSVANFVLCFSLLAPLRAGENCKIVDAVAGFTRLRPDDAKIVLASGQSWSFRFSYQCSLEILAPSNHSFGPQSAYVEIAGQPHAVDTQPMAFKTRTKNKAKAHESVGDDKASDSGLRLLPAPSRWQPSTGVCRAKAGFLPVQDSVAVTPWQSVVGLSERLGLAFASGATKGVKITIVQGDVQADSQQDTSDESYELSIRSEDIILKARGASGFFYGFVSLLQLHFNYRGCLPCGLITDNPRFEWRGQHLDCARQFFSVDNILSLLDLMALLKLNRFHWHASDDEAFRFELASSPQLKETVYRGHGQWLPGVFGAGIGPVGGSYSKADMGKVVAHARDLNIRVMAEINMPGHALAMVHALPTLLEPDAPCHLAPSIQGYCNNVINPGLPSCLATLTPILTELCALFPDAPLHLGGDEVAEGVWDKSPAVLKLKEKYDLEDQADVEGWFMQQVAKIVQANGRSSAAWQEVARGSHVSSGQETLIFAWKDLASGHALAREGRRVVLCPAEHTYFDLAISDDPQATGTTWAGCLPLEATTNWQIVPENEPELSQHIKGIQGAMWSETVFGFSALQSALAPRMLGVAESAWSDEKNRRQGADITRAARMFYPLFEAINWQYTSV